MRDVYPTTGWAGDTVAITSNKWFTNVTSVTIGGTACGAYTVVTTSLIACRLPSMTAGTTNDIAVINNGANVTDAGIYTHMKITYFNPSSSTVNIGGKSYAFYPNGFTSANCSSMTASNAAIGAEPASSIAYVRDARNSQTYRVKKMVDNKCWTVDNLKYIDATIVNSSDGTMGMTYNNGDHLANDGSGAHNTVDESSTQNDANFNKAFYNNPMGNGNCYGSTYLPAKSLTHCGYLYNWYAATNGTGTYSQSSEGTNVTGNICPANFRLPSAMSNSSTATGNGTSYYAADFAVLNASMNAGIFTTGAITSSSSYQAGWQFTGPWGGMLSGYWSAGLVDQGGYGEYWSSTADSPTLVRTLSIHASHLNSGNAKSDKANGLTIRCVIP